MKLKFFFFLLSFYILNSAFSIATIRYVSKTGTSTPPYTSWATAADSIQKCINICVDGDTVYVANGVYKENLVINTAISLIGSSMDSTVIDGTGLSDYTVAFNSDGSIENFNIYGRGETYSSGRTIRSNILQIKLIVKNCQLSKTGVGVSMAGGDLVAEKLIIKEVIRGFNLFGENNNSIAECVIIINKNNSIGISIGYAPNVDDYIIGNTILFTGTNNMESGISVGAPKSVHINNNLISGFWDNIFIDDPADTVFIINNVLSNAKGFGSTASIVGLGDIVVVKNAIHRKNDKAIYGNLIKSDYNLFWENGIDLIGLSYGDSDIVADPMFVNDTIPTSNSGYDFHLQEYSPAIDKGDPTILDLDGTRSDMGLFGGPYGQIYTYQDLAPKPPRNLTASMDSGLVHLKWNKNTEADLFRYRVYRDTVPDFIYDTTKIIAVVADSFYYDDVPDKYNANNYYYKLTALDNNYHQSAASEEVHINITGIPEAPPIIVEHYNLLQNYPNPFNPSTTIPYRLKAPGYVKVMVYNILGEMVRVLVNKYQNSGYYEVTFSPNESERKRGEEGFPGMHTWYHSNYVSGVYLYRIEVIGEGSIPVFTDMKKMMLVK